MKFIPHDQLAAALGWSQADLRAVRRCTECPVAPRRRGRQIFEIEAIIEWLAKILPRLSPQTELAIRSNAATYQEL